ncbi:MAG: hypothetical protein ABIQ18_26325 [Umezawaea sp.]
MTPSSLARSVFDSVSEPAIISSSSATIRARILASRTAASGLKQTTNRSSARSASSLTSLTSMFPATVLYRPCRDNAARASGLSPRSFSPRM